MPRVSVTAHRAWFHSRYLILVSSLSDTGLMAHTTPSMTRCCEPQEEEDGGGRAEARWDGQRWSVSFGLLLHYRQTRKPNQIVFPSLQRTALTRTHLWNISWSLTPNHNHDNHRDMPSLTAMVYEFWCQVLLASSGSSCFVTSVLCLWLFLKFLSAVYFWHLQIFPKSERCRK